MSIFFVSARSAGIALLHGADPHATAALDYNGVRAFVAQMIASLES